MSNMKICRVNAACVFLCVCLVCSSLPDGCFSHSFVVLLSFGGDKSFMASRNGSGLYSTPDKMATSFEGKTYILQERQVRQYLDISIVSEITDKLHG